MIKRMVEIAKRPAHLAVKHRQLELQFREGEPALVRIPCEDLGVLVIDHPQVTYTHRALSELMDCGVTVMLCGEKHLPSGVLLPLPDHSEVVRRIRDQVALPRALQKQLWKQLIVAKIRAQAANLDPDLPEVRRLREIARGVRSGDTANAEAQAAKVYWRVWLHPDSPFRRDADGAGANSLLNYGYAIVRAAIARAIVGAGLLPMFGINHSNRSNAFCLADDLIEPLRPLVDAKVRELSRNGFAELAPESKGALLQLLNDTVVQDGDRKPLQTAIHRLATSYMHCCTNRTGRLKIPAADEP